MLGRLHSRARERMRLTGRTAQQGENGDDPHEQGDAEVLHGHGSQVRNEQGEHQLRGLQLADLPLSHEADAHDNQQIQNDRSNDRSNHRGLSPFLRAVPMAVCPEIPTLIPGFLVNGSKTALAILPALQ